MRDNILFLLKIETGVFDLAKYNLLQKCNLVLHDFDTKRYEEAKFEHFIYYVK